MPPKMPRFAANISFMFTELPFLARFGAAAAAGFGAVEFHFPYDFDPEDVRAALDGHKLVPVLINVRAGDAGLGERGLAGLPGREESFRLCVAEAIEYANAIGVRQLNCLAGVQPPGVVISVEVVKSAARELDQMVKTGAIGRWKGPPNQTSVVPVTFQLR